MFKALLATCSLSVLLLECKEHKNKGSKYEIPDKGFLYAEVINKMDSTFPFYPVRNVLSNFDSTYDAFYTRKLLEAFDEPNISLRPSTIPTFRIICIPSTDVAYIVTITPTSITAKVGDTIAYLRYEEGNLSDREKIHFDLFRSGFPVSKRIKARSRRRGGLDSLVKLYPELNDEKYYHSLLNKAFPPLKTPFTFSSKVVNLKEEDFLMITQKLEKNGLWSLKVEEPCVDIAMDGAQYYLEFSSSKRYFFTTFLSGCESNKLFILRSAIREIFKQYNLKGKFRI